MTAPADCTCPSGAHGPVAGCAAHALPRRGDPTRDCACCGGLGWHLEGDAPDCGADLRAQLTAAERARDAARSRLKEIAVARDEYCRRDREADAAMAAHDALPNNTTAGAWMTASTAAVESLNALLATIADECGAPVISVYDEVYEARADRDETRLVLAETRAERGAAMDRIAALRSVMERCSVALGGEVGDMLRAALAADDAAAKARP